MRADPNEWRLHGLYGELTVRTRATNDARMAEVLTPDICVIGAGAGGLAAAGAAAAFGVPTVLVERGRMGGTNLNHGSVPAQALIAAARRAHALESAGRFGVKAQRAKIDFLDAHAHVESVVRAIAPNASKERLAGLGIQVIAGTARFTDRRTVAAGDGFEVRARRFVVATGSRPSIPPIPGLADAPYLTNETVFDLTQCPKHLIVIGAGPTALALAQAHRRLGAAVTVLDPAAQPLAGEDAECAAVVLDALAREGIAIRTGLAVARVERARPRVRVVLTGPDGEETIEGSHLLLAAGRTPNVEDLDLAAAGIACAADGIRVGRGLKTSNRRVYAIGDVVAGSRPLAHLAEHHAGLVVRNALLRLPVNAAASLIPRVIYTDPELAHVGLSEDEARRAHGTIRVLRSAYDENERACAEGEIDGHAKLVTDRHGRILGATVVGAQASELVALWTLAIRQRMTIGAIRDTVITYPTRTEIGRRAAVAYYTPGLTSPWSRRIMALLRRFG
jgi:pyruvate/2-oxoglutarate dehydrogenase complex dihydrolipoamide dehydrogenase (E3) component